jgi:hypothetical protein
MQPSKKGHSSESGQPPLIRARQRVAELEKRLGYQAKGLSKEDQETLESDFRNAIRRKKWIE